MPSLRNSVQDLKTNFIIFFPGLIAAAASILSISYFSRKPKLKLIARIDGSEISEFDCPQIPQKQVIQVDFVLLNLGSVSATDIKFHVSGLMPDSILYISPENGLCHIESPSTGRYENRLYGPVYPDVPEELGILKFINSPNELRQHKMEWEIVSEEGRKRGSYNFTVIPS